MTPIRLTRIFQRHGKTCRYTVFYSWAKSRIEKGEMKIEK